MIDQATRDRILDAAQIEEVIGDFVSLRKKGANYWGICPFHQDKNPSMSVSPVRGIFKCFACGKAGNAVSFVMEHEHKTYAEALRYLADKYHIEIEEKEESPEEIAHRMKYESLLVVTEYAQKFFSDVLWNDPMGQAVGLSYFRQRKFTDETIRKFGLGYSPANRPSLSDDAIKKGYKEEYLVETGLCIKRDNGSLGDRFFDRVIFPIYSISGRVIAFGGRTLKTDKSVAKYVNSPESEIYFKSNSLYGLYQAKNSIIKKDRCILVEGYADVISMHQSGIENVVASSGTSLTQGQIRLIKRFTTNITLLYDGDGAGIKAALRGTDLILEEGMSVKVVLIPDGADPDDFAKAHTREEIEEFLSENASDFITFKSDLLSREMNADPLNRSKLIADIIQSIAVIPDSILRNIYVKSLVERFDLREDDVLAKIHELREAKKRLDRMRDRQPSAPDPNGNQSGGDPGPEAGDEPPAGQASEFESVGSGDGMDNPYLAVQERELLYYLLKFGAYPFYTEKDLMADATRGNITVEDYIRNSLADDNLTFANTLLREMFDEYYRFIPSIRGANRPEEEYHKLQERTEAHFVRHENQQFLQTSLEILLEPHPLKVQVFKESIEPEEHRLGEVVPKAVGLYKLRIIEQMCVNISRQLADAEHRGDTEAQKAFARQFQVLTKAKLSIAKELNRV